MCEPVYRSTLWTAIDGTIVGDMRVNVRTCMCMLAFIEADGARAISQLRAACLHGGQRRIQALPSTCDRSNVAPAAVRMLVLNSVRIHGQRA